MFIRVIREICGHIKLHANDILFLNTPTRYESVGCDDENFSSLKEYEFTRIHESHESCKSLRPCWPSGWGHTNGVMYVYIFVLSVRFVVQ